MNLKDLTLGELERLKGYLGAEKSNVNGLCDQIGEKVIVRTYSAGVWYGELEAKIGNEVYLKNARRMYRWWCAKSISLSGIAEYGIIQEKSKICSRIKRVWLEAIEILTLSNVAIESLERAEDVEAE